MSKYQPLVHHLNGVQRDRIPMSFGDVEQTLGFTLPASARQYPAWWANNHNGRHVHTAAWMRSGWRTCGVDLNSERVVFVRDAGSRRERAPPAPPKAPPSTGADMVIAQADLHGAAHRMLEEIGRTQGVDMKAALLLALDEAVLARRKQMLAWFAGRSGPQSSDSVELIREDRERDEYGMGA